MSGYELTGPYGQEQPEYGAQPGYGAGDELPWRLILSGTARKLMIGFLALGVLVSVSSCASAAATMGSGVSATNAANQVLADASPLTNAVNNYTANVKACKGQLGCVTTLDRRVAATFNTFAGQLRSIPLPSGATAANAALATAVSSTASIYARLGAATSANQYISEASSAELSQALNRVNKDYANLGTALGA